VIPAQRGKAECRAGIQHNDRAKRTILRALHEPRAGSRISLALLASSGMAIATELGLNRLRAAPRRAAATAPASRCRVGAQLPAARRGWRRSRAAGRPPRPAASRCGRRLAPPCLKLAPRPSSRPPLRLPPLSPALPLPPPPAAPEDRHPPASPSPSTVSP